MTYHSNCAACANWTAIQESDYGDNLVGTCAAYNQLRFRNEGVDDFGNDCPYYSKGEYKPRFTIAANRYKHTLQKMIDHDQEIQQWRAEGKSQRWIADQLSIPSQVSVSMYLRRKA